MTATASSGSDGYSWSAFWPVLVWAAAAIVFVLVVTYVAGRIVRRHSVIDTAWGLLFGAAAIAAFGASAGSGNAVRRWLLLGMTLVWGLRLALHIGRRSIGKVEDPRYEALLRNRGPFATVLLVYGLQGVLALVISAPILIGMLTSGSVTPIGWLGVLGWLIGLYFEAIGDWQMERYKADKAAGRDVPPVMDRGLWRFTRHPNYFGDACVWVGIFCVAAERWPGILTVFAPVIMIYLLAFGSGKRVLERSMSRRDGYREYMKRTSGFVPLPPRPANRP